MIRPAHRFRARTRTVVALVAGLALLAPVAATSARAGNPSGPRLLASTKIDAHLGYMPQTTCSPSAKPGAKALLKLLIKTWGGVSSGISRGCDSMAATPRPALSRSYTTRSWAACMSMMTRP